MSGLIVMVFIVGYGAIVLEHKIKINKAALALITGTLCWVIYMLTQSGEASTNHALEELMSHFGEISGILFFLLGAMTIVELIDVHDGFSVITSFIHTKEKRQLIWVISLLAFFMSAILDNLTTTIVIVSLLRKLIPEKEDRMMFIGMTVIAANAGGAWSPIGDVTTTMLWIGGQITADQIMPALFFPSLVCILVPLYIVSFSMKGNIALPPKRSTKKALPGDNRNLILLVGMAVLIFVPVFKGITHLPPFMGVLFGLGVLWLVSELVNKNKDEEEKSKYSIVHALQKIDTSSILFFLGILLSISALSSMNLLSELATYMDQKIGNESVLVLLIGLFSAVIDNVPLVAAAMGMYDLTIYPVNDYFWEFLAYCAGTGGSILIIGSASGVAAMGMEKIKFFWYVKKIGWLALIGYFAGAMIYILQN